MSRQQWSMSNEGVSTGGDGFVYKGIGSVAWVYNLPENSGNIDDVKKKIESRCSQRKMEEMVIHCHDFGRCRRRLSRGFGEKRTVMSVAELKMLTVGVNRSS